MRVITQHRWPDASTQRGRLRARRARFNVWRNTGVIAPLLFGCTEPTPADHTGDWVHVDSRHPTEQRESFLGMVSRNLFYDEASGEWRDDVRAGAAGITVYDLPCAALRRVP